MIRKSFNNVIIKNDKSDLNRKSRSKTKEKERDVF